MKYIVMETALSYAVVMDEQGKFIKVPNLNYEVGETLDSVYIAKEERSRSFMFGRKIRGWVALAACILVCVLGGTWLWNDAASTVLIEINPSVLIEINRFGRVVDVEGNNFDGEEFIDDYDPEYKPTEEVIKELASLAKQKGYFEGGGQIRITADENETEIIAMLKAYFNNEVTVISGGEPWHDTEPKPEDIPAITDPEPEKENPTESPDPEKQEPVTLDEAVEIALENLNLAGAVCVKREFDEDDNRYEIEIVVGNTEYEYSVDPATGNILEITSEPVDYDD